MAIPKGHVDIRFLITWIVFLGILGIQSLTNHYEREKNWQDLTYPLKFPHSCNFTLHFNSTVMPVTAVIFKGPFWRPNTGRMKKNISRITTFMLFLAEASSLKMQKVGKSGHWCHHEHFFRFILLQKLRYYGFEFHSCNHCPKFWS